MVARKEGEQMWEQQSNEGKNRKGGNRSQKTDVKLAYIETMALKP